MTDARTAPPAPPAPGGGGSAGSRFGRSLFDLVRAFIALCRAGGRRVREWNRRDGAGESGLAQLIEVHVLQSAGDATVAVALAGSLFFSVPTHEARSRVALYLVVAVAPFAVVAPVLGPLLDRFRHGRRVAIAITMLGRAALALVIAHSLNNGVDALALYPAALGVLVAGKAYTIARSAAVPRLVPPNMTLVSTNARLTIAGVIAPIVAGGFAFGVRKTLGASDELTLGAIVYIIGAFFSLRLPATADGGPAATDITDSQPTSSATGWRARFAFPAIVTRALASAASLRWLSGFLLFYGAFVVREHSLSGLSGNEALGVLAAGIGLGNFLGASIGSRVKTLRSPNVGIGLLAATAVIAVITAVNFEVLSVGGLALVGAATAAMTKLALDSTIQERVNDAVRTSTFGRSETAMQLAWVMGGVIGILLPTNPRYGFTVASGVLGACVILSLFTQRRSAATPPADGAAA